MSGQADRPIWVVTGATGYVGKRLAARLAREGVAVVAFCRRAPDFQLEGVDFLEVADWSAAGLSDALDNARGGGFRNRQADGVFHLAAYGVAPGGRETETMMRVNASLPASLAAFAADRAARFVTAGTNAEYADPVGEARLGEDAPLQSRRLYGASKAAGWLTAASTAAALGLPHIHLRLFNVYGAHEAPHRLTASLLSACMAGETAALSDGGQVRDFLYIDDAIDAFLAAAKADLAGLSSPVALNVCTGVGTSVRCFAEELVSAFGADPNRTLGFGQIERRADDIEYLVGDPFRAAQALGWRARYSVAQGLAEVAQSVKGGRA